jgi:ABC-type uncharacterized transport system permease subunit
MARLDLRGARRVRRRGARARRSRARSCFAAFDALQLRLQQASGAKLPYQVYLMLPYALSILALVLMARRAAYPQALMKPYRKGER